MPSTSPDNTSHTIAWPDAQRHQAFDQWMAATAAQHGLEPATLRSASSDASFRRYFRVTGSGGSFIVMDAPPSHEDVRPFVHVAALAQAAGLHVPQVIAQDVAQGFLLLTDLGSALYLNALQTATAQNDAAAAATLMREATQALVRWQQGVPAQALPASMPPATRRSTPT